MRPLVWVVDDSPLDLEHARRAIGDVCETRAFTDGSSVIEQLATTRPPPPDVLVLDWVMPGVSGIEVVRFMRAEGQLPQVPVLLLTARGEPQQIVEGLSAGANDYLAKPYHDEELRARVAALLRRAAGPAADTTGSIILGPLVLDVARRAVRVGATPVELTPREYELLKVLMGQPGRLVTRGTLLRAVWGRQYVEEDHYLHVYVSRLRRKLAAADPTGSMHDLITAEPGVGYRIRS